jgi:hypothetical protein
MSSARSLSRRVARRFNQGYGTFVRTLLTTRVKHAALVPIRRLTIRLANVSLAGQKKRISVRHVTLVDKSLDVLRIYTMRAKKNANRYEECEVGTEPRVLQPLKTWINSILTEGLFNKWHGPRDVEVLRPV